MSGTGEAQGCIFCDALAHGEGESLILFRGPTCFVILNLYPYNNGHLMVVPIRHVGNLGGLSREELTDLMLLIQRAETALDQVYRPSGMNIGINLGRPAGAGVLDHLHVHVVPRWTGDTNFMTVVGNARVLPEELPETARKLRPMFERLDRA